MNSLELLKSLNSWLVNGNLIPEEYDILVAGEAVTKDGEVTGYKFIQTTKPRADAAQVGVGIQQYFRTSYTKTGGITKSTVTGEDSFKGLKKPQTGNIFKNTQPLLFDFVAATLRKKEYDEKTNPEGGYTIVGDKIDTLADGSTRKMTIVRVKATNWGAVCNLTVPKYELTSRDENGKAIKFKAPKYNAKTDRYEQQNATSISLQFFADLSDIDRIEQLAVSLYERQVMNNEVGETTTTVKKGNEVIQKVTSPTITDDDPESTPIEGGEGEGEETGEDI